MISKTKALYAEAVDVEVAYGSAIITTAADDLWQAVTALRGKNYVVDEFEHRYLLNDPEHSTAHGNEEGLNMSERFLSKLDENEDVTHVDHNAAVE